MSEDSHPPRAPRMPMVAQLEVFEGSSLIGTVLTRNISERGIGGRGYVSLSVDQSITIALDGSPRLPARVAWKKGGDFGLELRSEIDLADYEMATTLSGDARHV